MNLFINFLKPQISAAFAAFLLVLNTNSGAKLVFSSLLVHL